LQRVSSRLKPKLALMDVTASTNTRTLIACFAARMPANHKVPVLLVGDENLRGTLLLVGLANSMCCDFTLRQRLAGTSLSWFVLSEAPVPLCAMKEEGDARANRITSASASLCLIHRHFAPEWLRMKHSMPESFSDYEWKHCWAITQSDRLRLRTEIDALSASLYGLSVSQFEWLTRNDPTDAKSFYRMDRDLPQYERLTGLAAAAFRAMLDGKWSADSVDKLSNDEFFDLIGIPEMTSEKAAKASHLPEPLIYKRQGCHKWEPEKFTKDDSRYGWTWDHCWQDAITLLGSEQAVKDYIEGKPPASQSNQIERTPKKARRPAKSQIGQTELF